MADELKMCPVCEATSEIEVIDCFNDLTESERERVGSSNPPTDEFGTEITADMRWSIDCTQCTDVMVYGPTLEAATKEWNAQSACIYEEVRKAGDA
jgi:hypothetical protein